MSLKAMYNTPSPLVIADQFGSITTAQLAAVEQISQQRLGKRLGYKVLDFGVGNGLFLKKLQQCMPQADFTGIDISTRMLVEARKNLALTVIEGNATQASRYLPLCSQDLVLAHFINAYVSIPDLFKEARILTRPNGFFSFITTTYESFPLAQARLANFIAADSFIGTTIGHYYKAMIKNTTVVGGKHELVNMLAQQTFTIKKHRRLAIPITLNTPDELALFSLEGTWFLNSLPLRMLPKPFLLARLKKLFSKIFEFPYHDTHIIDIVLAQKI
ncbi:MAG: methyltransferase [Legionellaceae bacterium]|nr:methyltransferase [Legionellaceae bacterium]HAF87902.1 methyltransferase [Legionellales bacterium]HCA89039.1 methyltransferase [Legionellales bacterium]|tara:strand:- start:2136 stop:2954 length:819 start_codon:yes stop_codon:yes gene_type:complete